jgi:1-acyl-sn-glycerol-3-phosphate acyltransferase
VARTAPRTSTARLPNGWVDLGYGPKRLAGFRDWLARAVAFVVIRPFFRLRVEGLDRLPPGSSVLCFNHLNWIDPIVLEAAMPARPRLYFFGPKEADMSVGLRNRLMRWAGNAVAYQPGNRDMIVAVRRVEALMTQGVRLAIAGEGRIHVGETVVPPLNEGAAFFALRTGVPIVPVAINGTSWLGFGRVIRVRVGEAVSVEGRDRKTDALAVTEEVRARLAGLVADFGEPPPSRGFWRRLTDAFNDWEGPRPPHPGTG